METGTEILPLHHELDNHSEDSPKGDLRKMMSQHPLPVIAPGTVDPASMDGEKPTEQALAMLKTLNAALAVEEPHMLESCFFPEQAYWKDQLALTYHLRTFVTPGIVAASLLETKILRRFTGGFEIAGKAQFVPATPVLVRYLPLSTCLFLFSWSTGNLERSSRPRKRCRSLTNSSYTAIH